MGFAEEFAINCRLFPRGGSVRPRASQRCSVGGGGGRGVKRGTDRAENHKGIRIAFGIRHPLYNLLNSISEPELFERLKVTG